MNDLVRPVLELFELNSTLVGLALSDLSNEDAVHRLKDGAGSSISYLVGHLSSSRHGLLKRLGAAEDNPFAELFGSGVGSKDGDAYPDVSKLAASWAAVSARLHNALGELVDEDLLADTEDTFPIDDKTLRGALTFLAWHESYHLGQIGLLRTELGYPSVRQRLLRAMREG